MVLAVLLLCHLSWVLLAAAEVDPALTGTWVTKSRSVVTGPVCVIQGVLSASV
jgi:hypothetical protein